MLEDIILLSSRVLLLYGLSFIAGAVAVAMAEDWTVTQDLTEGGGEG